MSDWHSQKQVRAPEVSCVANVEHRSARDIEHSLKVGSKHDAKLIESTVFAPLKPPGIQLKDIS